MTSEKDVETPAGAHGHRGSSSEQGTLTERDTRQKFNASTDLEKGEKTEMEERKSFDDVEDTPDSEPYQEVSFQPSLQMFLDKTLQNFLRLLKSLAKAPSSLELYLYFSL